MNHQHVGWQCPCCRKVYAPSVTQCAPCSGGGVVTTPHLPFPQPIVVPSVWEPPYTGTPYIQPDTMCEGYTIVATDRGGWLVNGEAIQLVPTEWKAH